MLFPNVICLSISDNNTISTSYKLIQIYYIGHRTKLKMFHIIILLLF